jgi:hypothetical protein
MTPPRKVPEPAPATRLIARNARARRRARELSTEALGDAVAAQGLAWNRSTVVNLEGGRRRDVTVDELLAMAVVLDCAPADLLVPLDSDDEFRPTPVHAPMAADDARVWIGGRRRPRMVLIDSDEIGG